MNYCLRFWDIIIATDIFSTVSIIMALVKLFKAEILKMDIADFMEWF
jgi:hypothetical protein